MDDEEGKCSANLAAWFFIMAIKFKRKWKIFGDELADPLKVFMELNVNLVN